MKIAIIGAGWYGCHLALSLKLAGLEVVVFEKNSDIFQGVSGDFGIRLHEGPHYLRSLATRENCREGSAEFKERYPELIVEHSYSIYGMGNFDADGLPSKVSKEAFEEVCAESASSRFIDSADWGFQNLVSAVNVDEPSIVLGERLREHFRQCLDEAGIPVLCNTEIKSLEPQENGEVRVGYNDRHEKFDCVINASGFQSLLPDDLPIDIEISYQPCLALQYKDKNPGEKPFSFTVMDGWFPCLMPVVKKSKDKDHHYIMTHGKWTIMGSHQTAKEAHQQLQTVCDELIESHIRRNCEREMKRFWPGFADRFEYEGWKGTVIAKPKTKSEFRSAFTYKKSGIIYVVPGKIADAIEVEREVFSLLNKDNILSMSSFEYVKNGVLDKSMEEILTRPEPADRSTCNLQTLSELKQSRSVSSSSFWQPVSEQPQESGIKTSFYP